MKVPTLKPVKSSNIEAVGFDSHGLHVQFKGGKLYTYPKASKHVHDEMLKAESVGKYFFAHVKNKFDHKPVDE